ncbi:unnamed protein product, partial [Pylaiella littoralis]
EQEDGGGEVGGETSQGKVDGGATEKQPSGAAEKDALIDDVKLEADDRDESVDGDGPSEELGGDTGDYPARPTNWVHQFLLLYCFIGRPSDSEDPDLRDRQEYEWPPEAECQCDAAGEAEGQGEGGQQQRRQRDRLGRDRLQRQPGLNRHPDVYRGRRGSKPSASKERNCGGAHNRRKREVPPTTTIASRKAGSGREDAVRSRCRKTSSRPRGRHSRTRTGG